VLVKGTGRRVGWSVHLTAWLGVRLTWAGRPGGGADAGRWRGISRQSLPRLIPWEFRTMVVVAVQGAPRSLAALSCRFVGGGPGGPRHSLSPSALSSQTQDWTSRAYLVFLGSLIDILVEYAG